MPKDHNEAPEAAPSTEGKRAWVNPKISTFAARGAEVIGNPSGTTDNAIYHS